MKDLEELKKEQAELKGRLVELIDVINSEEFYSLDETKRTLMMSQRAGMEIYLNSLTQQIYGPRKMDASSNLLPLMLMSMMSPFPSSAPSTGFLSNQTNKEEKKDDEN